MKSAQVIARAFIPPDIRRVSIRIRGTWTKLTDREITYYLDGQRDKLIAALHRKYRFSSQEQAEMILSDIERLT